MYIQKYGECDRLRSTCLWVSSQCQESRVMTVDWSVTETMRVPLTASEGDRSETLTRQASMVLPRLVQDHISRNTRYFCRGRLRRIFRLGRPGRFIAPHESSVVQTRERSTNNLGAETLAGLPPVRADRMNQQCYCYSVCVAKALGVDGRQFSYHQPTIQPLTRYMHSHPRMRPTAQTLPQ